MLDVTPPIWATKHYVLATIFSFYKPMWLQKP